VALHGPESAVSGPLCPEGVLGLTLGSSGRVVAGGQGFALPARSFASS